MELIFFCFKVDGPIEEERGGYRQHLTVIKFILFKTGVFLSCFQTCFQSELQHMNSTSFLLPTVKRIPAPPPQSITSFHLLHKYYNMETTRRIDIGLITTIQFSCHDMYISNSLFVNSIICWV